MLLVVSMVACLSQMTLSAVFVDLNPTGGCKQGDVTIPFKEAREFHIDEQCVSYICYTPPTAETIEGATYRCSDGGKCFDIGSPLKKGDCERWECTEHGWKKLKGCFINSIQSECIQDGESVLEGEIFCNCKNGRCDTEDK